MKIDLNESDAKTLKIIQEDVKKSYEQLGVMSDNYEQLIERFEEDKAKVRDKIKRDKEQFNSLINTFIEKYELDDKKRWTFNGEKFTFEEMEEEE